MKIAFVGQGPNQTAWKNGLERGARTPDPVKHAEAFCSRLAITGRLGESLAALIGVHRLKFYSTVDRLNLNARWNGKAGKGDVFDHAEGVERARKILLEGDHDRIVLLGQNVARCFSVSGEFLTQVRMAGKLFLLFPHPSGVNLWWNGPGNRARASTVLRLFTEELFPDAAGPRRSAG